MLEPRDDPSLQRLWSAGQRSVFAFALLWEYPPNTSPSRASAGRRDRPVAPPLHSVSQPRRKGRCRPRYLLQRAGPPRLRFSQLVRRRRLVPRRRDQRRGDPQYLCLGRSLPRPAAWPLHPMPSADAGGLRELPRHGNRLDLRQTDRRAPARVQTHHPPSARTDLPRPRRYRGDEAPPARVFGNVTRAGATPESHSPSERYAGMDANSPN
jgi:hypothetical protein